MNDFERIRPYLDELQVTVSDAGHIRVPSQWRHRNHVNGNSCLYLFLGGKGSLTIGSQTFSPKPGQLYLLPLGERVSYATDADDQFLKYYCHFNASIRGTSLFQLLEVPFCTEPADSPEAERLLSGLVTAFKDDSPLAVLRCKSLLLELLYLLLKANAARIRIVPTPAVQKWNPVLRYMEERLSEPFTIEELAEAFNYSPKYFFRLFKASFGASPHQYLKKLRMEQAKKLLQHTKLSVPDVAAAVGMERSQFSKIFKQYAQATPAAFRRSVES